MALPVGGAAGTTSAEQAAPGRHAAAGGRAPSEVRDGTLPGTGNSSCFEVAWRVSPSLLHGGVGLASPPLPANLG